METRRITGNERPPRPIPVLLYHAVGAAASIADPAARRFCVGEAAFAAHLDAIRARRLAAATVPELRDPRAAPGVALTLDDGFATDYEHALPALQRAGLRATFFLNPARIGARGYLTWSQVRGLAAAAMAVESHGWDHADLTRLPAGRCFEELRRSRLELEDRLGRPVTCLAAPYGALNRDVVAVARQAGFATICSSANRLARPGLPEVPRLAIYARTRRIQVDRLLAGHGAACWLRRARRLLLAPARRWLRPAEVRP